MALSFVSEADAAAATVSLPTFTAGDIAIVQAYRNGSATPPSLPAGWTSLVANTGGNTNACRVGYRVLQGGDTSTGSWTNATDIQVVVLRGQDVTTPTGAVVESGSNAAPVSLQALTLQITDGTSWVVGLVGAKGTGTNSITISGGGGAPAMTLRSGSETHLGVHTVQVSGFTLAPSYDSQPSSSNVYRSASVEVRAAGGSTQQLTGSVSMSTAVAGSVKDPTFAGSVTGSTSVSGDAHKTAAVAGAVSAGTTVSGDAHKTAAVAGSVTGSTAVSGSVNRTKAAVAGAVTAGTSVAGGLTRTASVAGAVNGSTSVSGALTRTAAVAGTVTGSTTVTGAVVRSAAVAGSVAMATSASGSVTGSAAAAITGSAFLTLTVAGAAVKTANISGQVAMSLTIAGPVAITNLTGGVGAGVDQTLEILTVTHHLA